MSSCTWIDCGKEATVENETMGRVLSAAKIENIVDLYNAEKGLIPPEQVHRVEVDNALVDTGSTYIGMPRRLIQQLGLDKPYRRRKSQTAKGDMDADMYGPVRLTVMDRIYHGDITEVHEKCPVLIGQLALEGLDLVIDPARRCLMGNPEHGGEHIVEMY
jgi:predicted aspartyl protease